jgi:hypothetical protein
MAHHPRDDIFLVSKKMSSAMQHFGYKYMHGYQKV